MEEYDQLWHERKTLEEQRSAVTMKDSELEVVAITSVQAEEEQHQPDWEFEVSLEIQPIRRPMKVLDKEKDELAMPKTNKALTYPGTLCLTDSKPSSFFCCFLCPQFRRS